MMEDDAEQVQELEDMLDYASRGLEAEAQTPRAIWINPAILTAVMSRIYNVREYMRERNAA